MSWIDRYQKFVDRIKEKGIATPPDDLIKGIQIARQIDVEDNVQRGEERAFRHSKDSEIAALFNEDPTGEFKTFDVAQKVGMPPSRGNRSYIAHKIRQLRLTYQKREDTEIVPGMAAAD